MARIIGRERVTARLRGLAGEKVVREVGAALVAAGEIIKAEAQVSLTTGAVSGKNHVPSLPGEAPNSDTGHLKGNIEVNQVAPLAVEVSSNARYSAALEFGTSKMAARPFMGPAARRKKKEVVAAVNKAVARAVKS